MSYESDLPCPGGWHWRELGEQDYHHLAPVWRHSHRSLSRTPFWRDWFHALVDIHSGHFDQHFMHVVGLFDQDGKLRAIAAEVEHFDREDSSQILIQTSDAGQPDQLEGFSILAAIALAKRRGSQFANIQCHKDAAIYALALAQGEALRNEHHWGEFRIALNKVKHTGARKFYKLLGSLRLG